jgi:hypothetical protein
VTDLKTKWDTKGNTDLVQIGEQLVLTLHEYLPGEILDKIDHLVRFWIEKDDQYFSKTN